MFSKSLCLLFFLQSRKHIFRAKELFLNQGNVSTVKETFQSQENFPKTWDFFTVMKIFHSHSNFAQRIYLMKEAFHKQESFLQTKSFPQTNIFTQSKNVYANIDEKDFLKAKVLDPFNTTFYAKIFLIL